MENEKQNSEEKKEEIAEAGTSEDKLKDGLTDKKITKPKGEAKLSEAKPSDEKKEEKKKPIIKKETPKRDEAVVNAKSVPISTKTAGAICRFIKRKKINDCISYLEQTIRAKKAIPMKGEIPHRKGKGMMSGRYPKNASEHFIILLKSLGANATYHGLDANEVIISEAIANNASRPYGKRGRVRKKRTHVTIKCRENKEKKK